ncbi:MAG: rhomboid family intramembrane serine protease [Eubacteriales bacterium]
MKKSPKLDLNAPVVLGFTFLCLISLIASALTGGVSNSLFFCVYRSSMTDPLTYFRLFGHVFGHAGVEHFMGNITLILLLGPLLEEKYGSLNLACMIGTTALVTGLGNMIFFPNTALLGASGVLFAMILASSLTSLKDGKIPITFVLVAVLYLGQECFNALFVRDNISQICHIVGGIVGATLAIFMSKSLK